VKRRQLVLATAALAFAPLVRAQVDRVRRVGVLVLSQSNTLLVAPFSKSLAALGWIEGKNLALEVRHADNRLDRLPGLVAELVRLNVDVIVSASTPVTRAARDGTTIVPIVFTWVADPVGSSLISSLARPGRNLTGLSNQSFEIGPKQIELLKALIPNLTRVAELRDPNFYGTSAGAAQDQLKQAASRSGITVFPVEAKTSDDLESAFSAAARERATAMVVPPMPLYSEQSKHIAELAKNYRIPTAAQARSFVEAGGLVRYGSDLRDGFLRTAVYVDKILRGAKPANLPVEQMNRFETVVNRGTAKAFGITIPQSVLLRADEVIE